MKEDKEWLVARWQTPEYQQRLRYALDKWWQHSQPSEVQPKPWDMELSNPEVNDLRGVDFTHINLDGYVFVECDLSYANLSYRQGKKMTFFECKLNEVDFSHVEEKLYLQLEGVEAINANFSYFMGTLWLDECNFHGVNFSYSHVIDCHYRDVDFTECDFTNAYIFMDDLMMVRRVRFSKEEQEATWFKAFLRKNPNFDLRRIIFE